MNKMSKNCGVTFPAYHTKHRLSYGAICMTVFDDDLTELYFLGAGIDISIEALLS